MPNGLLAAKVMRLALSTKPNHTCAFLFVGCRFAAVVELEMALVGNPDKRMLMRALARRRDNQFDNFFDRLITELFITGVYASLPLALPLYTLTMILRAMNPMIITTLPDHAHVEACHCEHAV